MFSSMYCPTSSSHYSVTVNCADVVVSIKMPRCHPYFGSKRCPRKFLGVHGYENRKLTQPLPVSPSGKKKLSMINGAANSPMLEGEPSCILRDTGQGKEVENLLPPQALFSPVNVTTAALVTAS